MCVASNPAGSSRSEAASLSLEFSGLVNLSARASVGTGANVVIPGITVRGTKPKTLLIRAAGPALAAFGVGGTRGVDGGPPERLRRECGRAGQPLQGVVGHGGLPQVRLLACQPQRGERPQEGRFREFTQADIDVIGRDALAFHHEVEVALVMAEVFRALPCPPAVILVNNRKLAEGFFLGVGAADPLADALLVPGSCASHACGRVDGGGGDWAGLGSNRDLSVYSRLAPQLSHATIPCM